MAGGGREPDMRTGDQIIQTPKFNPPILQKETCAKISFDLFLL